LVETTSKMCPNEKPATRSVSSSSTFSGVHQTAGSASQTSSAIAAAVATGSRRRR
jgi:hypothetical protein